MTGLISPINVTVNLPNALIVNSLWNTRTNPRPPLDRLCLLNLMIMCPPLAWTLIPSCGLEARSRLPACPSLREWYTRNVSLPSGSRSISWTTRVKAWFRPIWNRYYKTCSKQQMSPKKDKGVVKVTALFKTESSYPFMSN